MAVIKSNGALVPITGTRDGIITYCVGDQVRQRRVPTAHHGAKRSSRVLLSQELFRLQKRYYKLHRSVLSRTIGHDKTHTACNVFMSVNKAPLRAALSTLAYRYLAFGREASDLELEQAVAAYAADNPTSIVIVNIKGYQPRHLAGYWPENITLTAE